MDELIVDVAYHARTRHENAGHSSKTRQAIRTSPQSRLLPAAVNATRTDKVSSSEGLIERGPAKRESSQSVDDRRPDKVKRSRRGAGASAAKTTTCSKRPGCFFGVRDPIRV
ncbi:hypothetical protein HYQ46_008992 [Verticillium longisporum]|nr:hypothetical protein HYQ46_008992 [Verticillium longisporum]